MLNRFSNVLTPHFWISMGKSVIRVGAGIELCLGALWQAGVMLILAEVLGIVEELFADV